MKLMHFTNIIIYNKMFKLMNISLFHYNTIFQIEYIAFTYILHLFVK